MSFSKTGVLSFLAVLCMVPLFAHAHATPVTYTPVAGETVLEAPASISVRFTERIEMGASSLTVFGPEGEEVQETKGSLSNEDPRLFSVPITSAGEGVYTVSWQVVSVDDGHFTKGAYSFLVDAEGKAFEGDAGGTVEVIYSSQLTEALLSFMVLIGESIVLIAFAVLVGRSFFPSNTALAGMITSMPRILAIGTVLFIAGSVISFLRKSIELASLQNTTLLEAVAVYGSATAGSFIVLKIIAVVGFVVLFYFMWAITRMQKPVLLVVLLMPLLAILFMQSQVSHAAASHVLPELSVLVTMVHLLAKELIVGGLLVLSIVLFLCGRAGVRNTFLPLLRYFNLLASVCLIGAASSGVYVTWLHLKDVDNLFLTQWGERFIYLIGATLVLGIFRLFHQFILTPLFASSSTIRKIAYVSIPAEAVVGLIVLFFSGYVSLTTPPYMVASYTYMSESVSEGVRMTLQVHPYEHDMMRISVYEEETGAPLVVDGVTITAVQTARNIGPNVLPAIERALGVYVFPKNDLLPPGLWEIDVIVDAQTGYDAYGQFTIAYPDEVDMTLSSDEVRSFDAFAWWMIIVGVITSVGGVILSWYAYRAIRRSSNEDIKQPYTPSVLLVLSIVAGIVVTMLVALIPAYVLTTTPLKQECLEDGHLWQQTYPTRDFEAVSPNAQLGCTVHQGHYHFIDLSEYHFFKGGQ